MPSDLKTFVHFFPHPLCVIFFTDGTKLPYLRPWDITTLKLLDTWKGSGRDKLKQEKTEVHMKLFMIVVLPQSDYEIPGLDILPSCFVNSFTVLYQSHLYTALFCTSVNFSPLLQKGEKFTSDVWMNEYVLI